jgi:hypothetical protein
VIKYEATVTCDICHNATIKMAGGNNGNVVRPWIKKLGWILYYRKGYIFEACPDCGAVLKKRPGANSWRNKKTDGGEASVDGGGPATDD